MITYIYIYIYISSFSLSLSLFLPLCVYNFLGSTFPTDRKHGVPKIFLPKQICLKDNFLIAPTVFEHVKHERSLLAHKVRIGYAHVMLWIFSWLASAPQKYIQLLISTLPIFVEGALGIHIRVSVRENRACRPWNLQWGGWACVL